MPAIQLEALDTLFFRDGKPFSMGEDTFAEGTFPPSPSVIYGALRTAYISQNLNKNKKTIEDLITETEGIVITNIAFNFDGQFRYPMPLDFVERKEKENQVVCLGLANNVFSGIDLPYLCVANEHVEQISDGVFQKAQLGDYLDGNTAHRCEIDKWSSFLTLEPKVGNRRNNNTRSTSDDDGNVYRVGMRRLENYAGKQLKILVDYCFKEKTIHTALFRFGAEGKAAKATINIEIPNIQAEQASEKHFKILLQTPAFFDNCSEPYLKWFEDLGFEVKLLTKVVGKPITIGGWNLKDEHGNQSPKPLMSATPAGSVFYYEIVNEKTVQELLTKSQSKYSISDQRQKEGFGLYKIANLNFNPIQL